MRGAVYPLFAKLPKSISLYLGILELCLAPLHYSEGVPSSATSRDRQLLPAREAGEQN